MPLIGAPKSVFTLANFITKIKAKCQRQGHTTFTTVLALTTLGDATDYRTNLICAMLSKEARASWVSDIAPTNFASVLQSLKGVSLLRPSN